MSAAAMERATSVDDLMNGFWRGLGQATGIGRTDSEAAFQEFLKRIPSTANLAAVAAASSVGDGSASTAQSLQQHVQQLSQGAPVSGGGGMMMPPPPGSSGGPVSDLVTSSLALGIGGIPRVPSLDFLRQLMVSSNQQFAAPPAAASSTPPIKPEPAPAAAFRMAAEHHHAAGPGPDAVIKAAAAVAAAPHAGTSAGALPAGYPLPTAASALGLPVGLTTDLASLTAAAVGSNLTAALAAVPGFQAANPLVNGGLNPAAAAAAALQLGQLSRLATNTATSSQGAPERSGEFGEKAEVRRARRCVCAWCGSTCDGATVRSAGCRPAPPGAATCRLDQH